MPLEAQKYSWPFGITVRAQSPSQKVLYSSLADCWPCFGHAHVAPFCGVGSAGCTGAGSSLSSSLEEAEELDFFEELEELDELELFFDVLVYVFVEVDVSVSVASSSSSSGAGLVDVSFAGNEISGSAKRSSGDELHPANSVVHVKSAASTSLGRVFITRGSFLTDFCV